MNAPMKISFYRNLLIGIVFFVAGCLIVLLVNYSMKNAALREAESKVRLLLDRNLATHAYFSRDLKPKLFTFTDPYRPKQYFEPTWMSSTFAIREIDKYAKSLTNADYYYKECAINARTPENEADAIEREFLKKLNSDPRLVQDADIRNIDGKPYFVVIRRGEVLEESCLRCHSTPDQAPAGLTRIYGTERSFNRKVGEVISAISIRVPLEAAYADANRVSLILSGMLLLVLLLLFGVQAWISKKLIFSPLADIQEKAIQIATDERFLGEQIPAPKGRELADLTSAFNTMSASLRQGRDNLETQVKERTKDLQHALNNVKTLKGMLPICANCKKIRSDDGYWKQIEVYLSDHSDAEFSHGICPECSHKLYSQYFGKEKK